jgi:hypothetical protein
MVDELYVERDSADISSDINKSFDELVLMSEKEFRAWAISMREELAKRWQERRLPPALGFTTENIESQFRVISHREVTDLLVIDELTSQRDCILADTRIGSACRAFFPGIAKTKDVAATSGKGYSQWDLFTDPALCETFIRTAHRHFKRDGFYAFSRPMDGPWTGRDWIELHQKDVARGNKNHDFWLEAVSSAPKHEYANRPRRITRERRNPNLPRTILKRELEELRANRIQRVTSSRSKSVERIQKPRNPAPYRLMMLSRANAS